MAAPKGHPRWGGRKPGSKSALAIKKATVQEILSALDVNPIAIAASIAANDIECSTCHGTLKTKIRMEDGKMGERLCQSCWGTGKEAVVPETRLKASAVLLPYLYPQLKQIEHTGAALENRPAVQITFVEGSKTLNIHAGTPPAIAEATGGDTKVYSNGNKTIVPVFKK